MREVNIGTHGKGSYSIHPRTALHENIVAPGYFWMSPYHLGSVFLCLGVEVNDRTNF